MNDSQGDDTANPKKAKDGKLPAFQFYPGDWKRHPGLTSLLPAERWYWLELVMLMHDSKERGVLLLGNVPMPEEAVAMNLNLDNQTASKLLTKLVAYGVATMRQDDGAICCDWMLRQENIRSIRRIAGLQGGNPNLLKQKSTTGDKQKTTPSSSSSSSSSDLNTGNSPQLPLMALPVSKAKTKKVKQRLVNLVDMTEAEITSLGRHPSPLAPKHLTRKKDELIAWDEEESVWMTEREFYRLREKLGGDVVMRVMEDMTEYFGIHPDRATEFSDHNLTLQNWNRRNG